MPRSLISIVIVILSVSFLKIMLPSIITSEVQSKRYSDSVMGVKFTVRASHLPAKTRSRYLTINGAQKENEKVQSSDQTSPLVRRVHRQQNRTERGESDVAIPPPCRSPKRIALNRVLVSSSQTHLQIAKSKHSFRRPRVETSQTGYPAVRNTPTTSLSRRVCQLAQRRKRYRRTCYHHHRMAAAKDLERCDRRFHPLRKKRSVDSAIHVQLSLPVPQESHWTD